MLEIMQFIFQDKFHFIGTVLGTGLLLVIIFDGIESIIREVNNGKKQKMKKANSIEELSKEHASNQQNKESAS